MLDYTLKKGTLVVRLYGELDHASSAGTRAELDLLFKNCKFDSVVLDMSGLTFMDSTGVGLIMGRYKTLRSLNRAMYVSEPGSVVDKVLKVSGIYSIIPKI